MRIILDTNVFVSGIFWSGTPSRIINAWVQSKIKLVISPDILGEYKRVAEILCRKSLEIDLDSVFNFVIFHSEMCFDLKLPKQICDDPDDDKFLACALASKVNIIVSGDKLLLRASGYGGIKVVTARNFVENYL